LDVASGALAIASGALEEKDPALSEKLGWASLGVGLPSMVYGGVKLVQGGVSLLRSANSLYEAGVGTMLRAAHEGGAAGVGRTAAAGMRAAAVLGAKVTAAAAKDGYSAEQTGHWDRVATRGLGGLGGQGLPGGGCVQSREAALEGLERIHAVFGAKVSGRIRILSSQLNSADVDSLVVVDDYMSTTGCTTNASELFLHRTFPAEDMRFLDQANRLIFNNPEAMTRIQVLDYQQNDGAWTYHVRTSRATTLFPDGGLNFIMDSSPEFDNPYARLGSVQIRSRLSDVFKFGGTVYQDGYSSLAGAVFIHLPPNIGLPYEIM
ncbi:hypothetical protein ACWKX9_26825, partial [Enterobacter asburiae]